MKKNNIILKRLSQFLIIAILIFTFVVGGQLSLSAYTTYAEDIDIVSAYEERNVLDDLEGSTIRGESFDLTKFPFNPKGSLTMLSLIEFGYDFDFKHCDDYGFYVYLYNPQGLKIVADSNLNSITLRFGTDKSQNFRDYTLKFLNCSTQSAYLGLFYKYKVLIDKSELEVLHGKLNSSERVYEVGEYEILIDGNNNPTSYFGRIYTYSGYSQGYGPDKTAPSSLTTTSYAGETLSLDVTGFYYRPEGNNGANKYARQSLHSVYFAVPNSTIIKYGELTAVHATWYNAILKPALVTGNKEVFNALSSYLYQDISAIGSEIGYGVIGAYEYDPSYILPNPDILASGKSSITYGYTYNYIENYFHSDFLFKEYGEDVSSLYLLFDSGDGLNSAKDYVVDSYTIEREMAKATVKLQGEKVGGYSKELFSYVSEEIDKNIQSTEDYRLNSYVLNDSWWERLWGNEYVPETDEFKTIRAIYDVRESDLSGSDSDISKKLYMSEQFIPEFKNYYNNFSSNNTIYIFRYMVSDYISQQATNFKYNDGKEKLDSNAYFCQETVNLDFDIIDVTFTSEDLKNTVIPVAMSPIDIIHDFDPPIEWDDGYNNNSWKLILGLILLILLLVLLAPVLPVVLRGAVAVIRLPFDLIRSISDLFKKNNRRR